MQTKLNVMKLKPGLRGLVCHPASKQMRPILQFLGQVLENRGENTLEFSSKLQLTACD